MYLYKVTTEEYINIGSNVKTVKNIKYIIANNLSELSKIVTDNIDKKETLTKVELIALNVGESKIFEQL